MPDEITTRWIRNASDERAVAAGCRFDEERGQHVLDFFAKFVRLYEGALAGEPLTPMPWQEDVVMRLFSWVKFSDRWNKEIRRFSRASIWCPKKNGKSPFLAAIGLYLLCADGEQGNKVFFGAKDGGQAREIAGKHAVEMVLASPALSAACTINRNAMQITHEESRSILKPMASYDSRSQESKEGINGSVLIDETHVVDADFISRVSRAGISRTEPFHVEVSTAGKNPQSYGKRIQDHGRLVENGDIDDASFFFVSYEAPQTLSDEDLAADPVKHGRAANPAWGYTVDEEEYLSDYNRSKKSVTDLADFKTYRLNIWQKAQNPWLRSSDWSKCGHAFTLADLAGKDCWLGLDMSKTFDMSAVVLTFAGDEEGTFKQLPYFWLPKATAEANNWEAAFLNWAKDEHLILIPGAVIEESWLEEKIVELNKTVRIQGVYYDRTFAEHLTQRLEQEHGIPRVEFQQSREMFAGPIDDYERLVVQGKLHHPNHPVFNWQAGHCEASIDAKRRKILVKPADSRIKKIDGMVAGVMSLFGAMTGDGGLSYSFYETHQLEMG